MPQMSPINWLLLMTYFIIILAIYTITNYYLYIYKSTKTTKSLKSPQTKWKW
uniref:ATP synthase complex subunit 8 n=1 Tax=Mordellochroa milleri TaxID=1588259 RepID=A0A343C1P5_9CUCU|nr:ATP synthase F0 subunit 8 [Mordellochroa milleri]